MTDTQQLELIGRHRLIEHLIQSGLEVALPIRDKGVDLVVYWNEPSGALAAFPVQLKAATGSVFSIFRKYADQPRLVIVYAWRVTEPAASTMLAMSYSDAVGVACDMGYTRTASWRDKGIYSVTRIGEEAELRARLEPFIVAPDQWREASRWWFFDAGAAADQARKGDAQAQHDLDAWLRRQGVPIKGDWPDWRSEVESLMTQGADVDCRDRLTLRRALTAHQRQDRFVEGQWASVSESGHIAALVRALERAPRD